jgi:esterase/lipase superfamily enzyme
VHGFNVSFDEALQRAAQLRRDLNYDSALFVFSWPSKGSMLRYGTDLDSAAAAANSLAEFLTAVEHATGAEKIHLVAHSMGNRVLLPALARIANDPTSTLGRHLGEIVLAAPAVPQADFVVWIDAIAARQGDVGRVGARGTRDAGRLLRKRPAAAP